MRVVLAWHSSVRRQEEKNTKHLRYGPVQCLFPKIGYASQAVAAHQANLSTTSSAARGPAAFFSGEDFAGELPLQQAQTARLN